MNIFRETGDVEEKPSDSRAKISGLKEDEVIKQVSVDNPETSTEQISQLIKSVEISASSSTIRRRLKSMGIKYCHPISKSLLLKRH